MGIIHILSGTPWWVYVIFAYLLIIGITALRQHEVPMKRLMPMPIILLAWSLFTIHKRYGFSLELIGLLLIALTIGTMTSYYLLRHGIHVDKKGLVRMPGSIYPLLFSMAFFFLKYFIGFTYAISPATKLNPVFWITDVTTSGLIPGFFTGRLSYILKLCRKN
jgi:hypothetical protein